MTKGTETLFDSLPQFNVGARVVTEYGPWTVKNVVEDTSQRGLPPVLVIAVDAGGLWFRGSEAVEAEE